MNVLKATPFKLAQVFLLASTPMEHTSKDEQKVWKVTKQIFSQGARMAAILPNRLLPV